MDVIGVLSPGDMLLDALQFDEAQLRITAVVRHTLAMWSQDGAILLRDSARQPT